MTLAGVAASPWAWHAHVDVWALIAVGAAAYGLAIARIGPSKVARGEPVVTRRQITLFALGLAALWVHSDWPVHDIAEKYLFSVHMFQHIGLSLIAAPLLLLGLPAWMVRWLLSPRLLHAVFCRVARPLPAAVIFNSVVILSHWPVVVNAALRHEGLHFAAHTVLFTSALVMWFPVVNRLPELPTMTYPSRMLYIFLQSVVPTIPASFLTFSDGVLYRFYAEAPRPFSISAIEDQQLAGAMMKVYAGALLWGIIVTMFFRWYAREELGKHPPDVLTWEDVDAELRRTEHVAPAEPRIPS